MSDSTTIYSMTSDAGYVQQADHVHSPNFDERPDGSTIDTIVVHSISLPPGEYGTDCVERLFTNRLDFDAHPYFRGIRGLEVSSHFYIKRSGALLQFVDADKRAWHAGESFFCGRARVNDFSIGIELEGLDDTPFEEGQYETLAALTATLMRRYPATAIERLCGHSDIAAGRKTDPGAAFNWRRFREAVCARL